MTLRSGLGHLGDLSTVPSHWRCFAAFAFLPRPARPVIQKPARGAGRSEQTHTERKLRPGGRHSLVENDDPVLAQRVCYTGFTTKRLFCEKVSSKPAGRRMESSGRFSGSTCTRDSLAPVRTDSPVPGTGPPSSRASPQHLGTLGLPRCTGGSQRRCSSRVRDEPQITAPDTFPILKIRTATHVHVALSLPGQEAAVAGSRVVWALGRRVRVGGPLSGQQQSCHPHPSARPPRLSLSPGPQPVRPAEF